MTDDDINAVLAPGTLVLCTHRLPSATQPWIHEFHVGIIVEPSDNPREWNGNTSEAAYCHQTDKAPVMYSFGKMYEPIADLVPITDAEAQLNHRAMIEHFLGADALATYDRAMTPPRDRIS